MKALTILAVLFSLSTTLRAQDMSQIQAEFSEYRKNIVGKSKLGLTVEVAKKMAAQSLHCSAGAFDVYRNFVIDSLPLVPVFAFAADEIFAGVHYELPEKYKSQEYLLKRKEYHAFVEYLRISYEIEKGIEGPKVTLKDELGFMPLLHGSRKETPAVLTSLIAGGAVTVVLDIFKSGFDLIADGELDRYYFFQNSHYSYANTKLNFNRVFKDPRSKCTKTSMKLAFVLSELRNR